MSSKDFTMTDTELIMSLRDQIGLRDLRVGQLERQCAILAARIDQLEAENSGLREHVRRLTSEAA